MRVLAWLLALNIFFVASAIGQQSRNSLSHRATRSGRTIILHPSEARFNIPADWLTWYNKFHNNLHLNAKELESVRVGQGEWDTEYALVVNSALSFQTCTAHVGGEGWGKKSSSFADVQLRVY